MKNLLFLLAGMAFPFLLFAQSNVLTEDAPAEEKNSAVKVMVIPFHPTKMYFSDCDRDLAKNSSLRREDVRMHFQAGMDYAAENWIEKRYESMNLFQMKDSLSKELLDSFYTQVSYAYDIPTRKILKKKKNIFKEMKEKISEATGKAEDDPEVDSYTTVEAEDEQYMRGTIRNPEFLKRMNEIYQPDFYVFVNQFEIKTDYEKCIDRELNTFRRRIKVHFNIYNPEGQMVYGDVITAKYDSNTNKVNKIIQDNFGFLAEYIKEALP
ncbi:MAG: hypothetical protein H6581_01370 [Bacteroidia bacterium]|nr:hypothetical protein [Bacteroidia bacterium]